MPNYEITYTRDYRQYGRIINAADWADAERQCGPGEVVSGQILQVIQSDGQLVADIRLRIGEAVREVING